MVKNYSKEEVLTFLRKNPIMNLAFMGDRKPHATVLLFHVTDDFTFYVGMRTNSYKGVALQHNPAVSFSVWKHDEMSVQADGFASVIDFDKVDDAITKITSSITQIEKFWPPVLRIEGDGYIAFEIKLTWLRALDLSHPTISEVGSPFTEFKFDS